MGIPRFYRWLSERYPLINENIVAEQIPEFDNLYLDMNGIVHNCSHNNTGGLFFKEEDDVFVEAFKYITKLFFIVKPKKLIYMAVDGCAPRAKMNQQRSRRFRAANDAREAREKAEEMGDMPTGPGFDSNVITPGTDFMARLVEHLHFFVAKKIQEDPLWQDVEVVVSGPDVPGEGEHKIMDYIRSSKSQPGFEPNQRHCLYGLDADLIMLALASHEPHFALLREEVVFGRRATETLEQRNMVLKDRFQLLHVSLLREYLILEFTPSRANLPFQFSSERLLDDFILFCVLVGNDFLPCLPFAEIGDSGLDDFFQCYKDHLERATGTPWLTSDCGEINFDQLASFLQLYGEIEREKLENAVDDQSFQLGRRRLVGPAGAPDPPSKSDGTPLELPATADDALVQWYHVKFDMDINTHEGTQQQRQLFHSYLEGLQWVMYYYYRGPDRSSWSWYYIFYHAPMAQDLAAYDRLLRPGIRFEVGEPFQPFQQLMAVLPANSQHALPECYRWLFDSADSPILHFYPQKFEVDIDGVKVPWGGITLIPFIDPHALLEAMAVAEQRGPALTDAESKRNTVGKAYSFRHDRNHSIELSSSMPARFNRLSACPVRISVFRHPPMPAGTKHFPNDVLPGCTLRAEGFPSVHMHPLTTSFVSGIKVFQFEAKGKGLSLCLHPSGPLTPPEEQMLELLRAPCAQIAYPVVHRGKVVAVHLPEGKLTLEGKTRGSPSDHRTLAQQLVGAWRNRGLTLEFEGGTPAGDAAAGRARRGGYNASREEEALQQPIVEVKQMESCFVDSEGYTQYVFKPASEFRLLHLVRAEEAPPCRGPASLAARFPIGSAVVCMDRHSEVFGQTGQVVHNEGGAADLQASFERGLSREEQRGLHEGIRQVVQRQHESLAWHELADVCKQVGLRPSVVKMVFGSLMARCADNVREDLGMNLMCETKGDGTALCLPSYSIKTKGAWLFSDLAITALDEYRQGFPGLFDALLEFRPGGRDFEAKWAFPDARDVEYATRGLVKYCNSCAWKKLRLASGTYMALTPASILEIHTLVEKCYKKARRRVRETERVRGLHILYKAEHAGSRPPAELLTPGSVMAGQRGLYVRAQGPVPCGARATVVGVYGQGDAQELELLLDQDSFGASDLRGRAPPMRGLLVPAAAFLPLAPEGPRAGAAAEPASAEPERPPCAGELFLGREREPAAPPRGAAAPPRGAAAAPSGAEAPSSGLGQGSKSEASKEIMKLLKSAPAPEPEEKASLGGMFDHLRPQRAEGAPPGAPPGAGSQPREAGCPPPVAALPLPAFSCGAGPSQSSAAPRELAAAAAAAPAGLGPSGAAATAAAGPVGGRPAGESFYPPEAAGGRARPGKGGLAPAAQRTLGHHVGKGQTSKGPVGARASAGAAVGKGASRRGDEAAAESGGAAAARGGRGAGRSAAAHDKVDWAKAFNDLLAKKS